MEWFRKQGQGWGAWGGRRASSRCAHCLVDWQCFIRKVGSQSSYKGREKLSSWHRLRNCWQALEGLFCFLWCLWCLVFFTLPLKWSQGHGFFGSPCAVMNFLLGALRNQSLHSHSWTSSWSHFPEACRGSLWPLAIPVFGLLETVDISLSGSNRRREAIRTFIPPVGAATSHLKSLEDCVTGSHSLGWLRLCVARGWWSAL